MMRIREIAEEIYCKFSFLVVHFQLKYFLSKESKEPIKPMEQREYEQLTKNMSLDEVIRGLKLKREKCKLDRLEVYLCDHKLCCDRAVWYFNLSLKYDLTDLRLASEQYIFNHFSITKPKLLSLDAIELSLLLKSDFCQLSVRMKADVLKTWIETRQDIQHQNCEGFIPILMAAREFELISKLNLTTEMSAYVKKLQTLPMLLNYGLEEFDFVTRSEEFQSVNQNKLVFVSGGWLHMAPVDDLDDGIVRPDRITRIPPNTGPLAAILQVERNMVLFPKRFTGKAYSYNPMCNAWTDVDFATSLADFINMDNISHLTLLHVWVSYDGKVALDFKGYKFVCFEIDVVNGRVTRSTPSLWDLVLYEFIYPLGLEYVYLSRRCFQGKAYCIVDGLGIGEFDHRKKGNKFNKLKIAPFPSANISAKRGFIAHNGKIYMVEAGETGSLISYDLNSWSTSTVRVFDEPIECLRMYNDRLISA